MTGLLALSISLAPGMVEAILEGRQPEGMTLPGLMVEVEVEWGEQRNGLHEGISTDY